LGKSTNGHEFLKSPKQGGHGKFLKRWMWDFLEGEIWGTCGFESLNFLSYEGRDPLDIHMCLKIECQQPNLKFNDVL